MDTPRRVQNQVNEGFGFEVSLDAVVLFDVRDQLPRHRKGGGWLPTLHSFCRSALFMDSRDSRLRAGAIAVGRRDRKGAEILSDGNQLSSVFNCPRLLVGPTTGVCVPRGTHVIWPTHRSDCADCSAHK